MHNKSDILRIVKEQLALEYNCNPADLAGTQNHITTVADSPQRRWFGPEPNFFKMVTMGQNAVLSTDLVLHPWLAELVADKTGHWLFEYENLKQLDEKLAPYGKSIKGTYHMFLPATMEPVVEPPVAGLTIKWLEEESDIRPYCGDSRFLNALCRAWEPRRPDVLAVTAWAGAEIVGMAGCSADTPLLWQIGIDVAPGHRGKGLGAALVILLKNEVIRRGKIPYYGTSLSNLHSWRIALRSGFTPAWVETSA